jgi:hypothetical protein
MGLTIHYQLATAGDEAHSRKLVQQLCKPHYASSPSCRTAPWH